jgi:hypothetical protein
MDVRRQHPGMDACMLALGRGFQRAEAFRPFGLGRTGLVEIMQFAAGAKQPAGSKLIEALFS